MLSEYMISSLTILASYAFYRRYGVRNTVPYPLIGAAYAVDKPLFGLFFLICFITALILGEISFRKFFIYGMRVFHLQLFVALSFMLPYSLMSSDVISLLLGLLPGQMAYDTHSSRDQLKTAALFLLTFSLTFLAFALLREFP